jgi:probable F420-dependent oxidoreductase
MKIGFSLPNIGPIGTAEAITKVAQRAEALGYSTLWTIERLLYPLKLQKPYPGTPDGHLPEIYKYVLDPLDALTYVAAQTKTIRLGTSVLDMPYHNPVVLARRLTSLDVLSGGRLSVGLGLGWNKDEMDATGADMTKRGALADEFLSLLKAIWTTNPVEFHGKFFNVPKSYIDLKPVQKPHPPIYLGAFAPAALKRLANMVDGWNPVFIPIPGMAAMFGSIQQMAKDAGRDPSALSMIVHAVLEITDKPRGKDRAIFSGSLEQISEDVRGCAKIGADEVFFDPAFAPGGQSLDRWLSLLEQLQGMKTVS